MPIAPLLAVFVSIPQWVLLCLGAYCAAAAHASCATQAVPISEIRRSVPSPWLGQMVSVRGVITANFSARGRLGGFFVQQADTGRRRQPLVPEGIFVRGRNATVHAGDLVRLDARVEEHAGRTALALAGAPDICAHGQAVKPAELRLPLADARQFDHYEDMLIRLPQKLTVSSVRELASRGRVLLSNGRLWQPTQRVPPAAAAALAQAQSRNRLVLDDGFSVHDPAFVPYPPPGLDAAHPLRAGQTVEPLVGILEMRYGTWQLQPLPGAPAPRFDAGGNPRPAVPARHARADLRVASFNVLNYFNGNDAANGFNAAARRGARDAAAFARQENKLVSALRGTHADIIGLMEIANNGFGPHSAIRRLAARLGPSWRAVDPGSPRLGHDAIMVALLYDSRTVETLGASASTMLPGAPRPPLAQTFRRRNGARPITVVVSHLKSKRCDDASGANLDHHDGQGCWNAARTQSASALAEWSARDPTHARAESLLIGDFNSYAQEDPPRALREHGYLDQAARSAGWRVYSYVHDGLAGSLDYAFARPPLAQRIHAAAPWHINADEPPALQYDAAGTHPERYAPDGFRSSDHDPLLIDLTLDGAV